jgi:DNA-binding phage protein
MSGLANQFIAGSVGLIFLYLVVTNYKGMTAVMKQGGSSSVSLIKALQGR